MRGYVGVTHCVLELGSRNIGFPIQDESLPRGIITRRTTAVKSILNKKNIISHRYDLAGCESVVTLDSMFHSGSCKLYRTLIEMSG